MPGIGRLRAIGGLAFAGALACAPAALAQGGSVQALFEKYKLIGTFAANCNEPPSGNNFYYLTRLIDAGHVQRDLMTGPTERAWFVMLDHAKALGHYEIYVSGKITGRIGAKTYDRDPADSVLRLEQDAMRTWDSSVAGEKIVYRGRLTDTGKDMPWTRRCGSPG